MAARTNKFVISLLEAAAKTMGHRAAERQVPAERSMEKTVAVFNTMHGTNLTEAQGWNFMETLKAVRSFTGDHRDDDIIDGLNYTALRGEARAIETINRHRAEQQMKADMAQAAAKAVEQENLPFGS